MLELFSQPEIWVALLTLTALEIVLGIDNIIFITILAGKLPEHQRDRARFIGLSLAMVMRIVLLFFISFIVGLTAPIFEVMGRSFSGRDLILIGGGLFLIAKATFEIHERLEGPEAHTAGNTRAVASFGAVLLQIVLLDAIFSIDSVITAVGLVDELPVMVIAIVVAVLVMLVSAKTIGEFVDRHPSLKMLALAFLLLIGTTLLAEGFHVEIPKGYIYFAMGFSVFVEVLNLRTRSRKPVKLRPAYVKDVPDQTAPADEKTAPAKAEPARAEPAKAEPADEKRADDSPVDTPPVDPDDSRLPQQRGDDGRQGTGQQGRGQKAEDQHQEGQEGGRGGPLGPA